MERTKGKIVTINEYNECGTRLVILLEIVMVIPVKYESLSRTNESQPYIDNDEIPGFLQ